MPIYEDMVKVSEKKMSYEIEDMVRVERNGYEAGVDIGELKERVRIIKIIDDYTGKLRESQQKLISEGTTESLTASRCLTSEIKSFAFIVKMINGEAS